jgi:hypothetical protein
MPATSWGKGRRSIYSGILYKGQIRGLTNTGAKVYSAAPENNARSCIYIRSHINALPLLELCSREVTTMRITCTYGGGCEFIVAWAYLPYDSNARPTAKETRDLIHYCNRRNSMLPAPPLSVVFFSVLEGVDPSTVSSFWCSYLLGFRAARLLVHLHMPRTAFSISLLSLSQSWVIPLLFLSRWVFVSSSHVRFLLMLFSTHPYVDLCMDLTDLPEVWVSRAVSHLHSGSSYCQLWPITSSRVHQFPE